MISLDTAIMVLLAVYLAVGSFARALWVVDQFARRREVRAEVDRWLDSRGGRFDRVLKACTDRFEAMMRRMVERENHPLVFGPEASVPVPAAPVANGERDAAERRRRDKVTAEAGLSVLAAAGLTYLPLDDHKGMVAGFIYWPARKFWRAADGSRQGTDATSLVVAVRKDEHRAASPELFGASVEPGKTGRPLASDVLWEFEGNRFISPSPYDGLITLPWGTVGAPEENPVIRPEPSNEDEKSVETPASSASATGEKEEGHG